jgi:hypothetical protein
MWKYRRLTVGDCWCARCDDPPALRMLVTQEQRGISTHGSVRGVDGNLIGIDGGIL